MSHYDASKPLQAVYVLTHDYRRPESGHISSGCDHVYGDGPLWFDSQICGQGIERHQDWTLYRRSETSGAWYRLDGNV